MYFLYRQRYIYTNKKQRRFQNIILKGIFLQRNDNPIKFMPVNDFTHLDECRSSAEYIVCTDK